MKLLVVSGLVTLLLMWMGLLSSGCSTILKNHAEVGFRYGTEVAFFHTATATQAESEASLTLDEAVLPGSASDEDTGAE